MPILPPPSKLMYSPPLLLYSLPTYKDLLKHKTDGKMPLAKHPRHKKGGGASTSLLEKTLKDLFLNFTSKTRKIRYQRKNSNVGSTQ